MREQRSKGAAGTAAGDGEASLGAAFVIQWVNELASAVRDQRDYLTQLDAAIGDADHGINLDRGLRAAVAKLEGMEQEAPGTILEAVGTALTFTVGGAAGPLYGSGFRGLGSALGSKERFGPEDLLVALRSGTGSVRAGASGWSGLAGRRHQGPPGGRAWDAGHRAPPGPEGPSFIPR